MPTPIFNFIMSPYTYDIMFSTILACILCTAPADDLIKQLSNDDYQIREQAEKKLIDLGREALEPCRKAIKTTTDPEVKRRCKHVCFLFYDIYNSKGFLPHLPNWDVDNGENLELKKISAEIREALKLENREPFRHYFVLAYNILETRCNDDYNDIHYTSTRLMCNDLIDIGWEPKKVQNLLDRISKEMMHGYKY